MAAAPPSTNAASIPAPLQNALSPASGALPAGNYYYVVTALTGAGQETTISNERSLPSVPANSEITVSWQPDAGATAYNIYRSNLSGTEQLIQTVSAPQTSYLDNSPGAGSGSPPNKDTAVIPPPTQTTPFGNPFGGSLSTATYYYVVTATTANGETTPSNELLVPVIGPNGEVQVNWTAQPGATGYKIYRGTASGAENELVGIVPVPPNSTAPSFSFLDRGTYGQMIPMDADFFDTVGFFGSTPGTQLGQNSFLTKFDIGLSDQYTTNFGGTTPPQTQGALILSGNQISNALDNGILVEASARGEVFGNNPDNNSSFPHQGSVVNTPTLNSDRLVPGVVITNNLIYGVAQGGDGITFAGDPNTSGPLAAVPFGRIVNNTIYGGYVDANSNPVGTGINVANNASPTMLNNVLANLNTGIAVDASSRTLGSPPVLGYNLFHNNVSDTADGALGRGSAPIYDASQGGTLAANAPLFTTPTTSPATANFYLKEYSQAIDSSRSDLVDRSEMTDVTGPLGIAPSPVEAPSVDLYGQTRVPDNNVPTSGAGLNPFYDRGAVERVDNPSVGLTAALLNPVDNNASDLNPAPNVVFIRGQNLEAFQIQFNDGSGPGVYDASVLASSLDVVRDGRLLTPNVDYFFEYDNNDHIINLVAASGVWLNGHEYDIYLDNGNTSLKMFDPYDPASTPVGITDRAGNLLQANEASGYTHFRLLLGNIANSAPVINVPTMPAIQTAYQASIPTSPALPPGAIYEGTSVTFGVAQGDSLSVYDVDANGGKETLTITASTGTLNLTNIALVGLESLGIDTNDIGNGTGTLTITAPLGDPTTVPPTPGLDTVLDGLVYTPDPSFNSQAFSQLATLTIAVDDNGNSPPPALTAQRQISFFVAPVNNPPYVTLGTASPTTPAEGIGTVNISAHEDTAGGLVFSQAGGNQIQVHDPDVENLPLAAGDVNATSVLVGGQYTLVNPYYIDPTRIFEEKITLTPATAGSLTLGGDTSGITPTTATGTSLDFTGTLSAIDAALATLTFTQTKEFTGTATIVFATNDNGNVGLGPAPTYLSGPQPQTSAATVALNVVSDDDAPQLVVPPPGPLIFDTLPEDAGSGFTGEAADPGMTVQSLLASAGTGTPATLPSSNRATLPMPVQNLPVAVSSGGTLLTGNYYYEVTALNSTVNPTGETSETAAANNEQLVLVTGPNGEVTVSWQAVDGATGYNIYRGTTSGGEVLVAPNVPAGTTDYLDQGGGGGGSPPATNTAVIAPPAQPAAPVASATGGGLGAAVGNTTYYYVVTATTADGETLPGTERSVTVSGDTNAITVSWSKVPGATGYKVYRGTTAGDTENILVGLASSQVTSLVDYGGAISTTARDATGDGIAVTGATFTTPPAPGTVGGQWQYSLDGLAPWTDFPTGLGQTNALLLASSDWVRYLPTPESSGNVTLAFNAFDGSYDFGTQKYDLPSTAGSPSLVDMTLAGFGGTSPFSTGTATATLTVTPDGDAPTLVNLNPTAPNITLNSVHEDAGQPNEGTNTNLGFQISDPLNGLEHYIQLNAASVAAGSAKLGIAVTGIDDSNGQWQWSTDDATWTPLSTTVASWSPTTGVTTGTVTPPTMSSALLLNGADYLRFLPNEEFFSTAANSPTISFAAWDQSLDALTLVGGQPTADPASTPAAPSVVDLSNATTIGDPSGSLPFSETAPGAVPIQTATAALSVTPDNDAPTIPSPVPAFNFANVHEDAQTQPYNPPTQPEPFDAGSSVNDMLATGGLTQAANFTAEGAVPGIAIT
ncbi:MAG: hypothetical protein B7Z73_02695, partial [Planctomycetia bacterium 21-64-5]